MFRSKPQPTPPIRDDVVISQCDPIKETEKYVEVTYGEHILIHEGMLHVLSKRHLIKKDMSEHITGRYALQM